MRTFLLSALVFVVISQVPAQTPSTRSVHVSVTDPRGRFVTGLERQQFEVVENGIRRAITGFSTDAPISLAIVSDTPISVQGLNRETDVLIQTRSLQEALRQLAASGNSRKALIVAT